MTKLNDQKCKRKRPGLKTAIAAERKKRAGDALSPSQATNLRAMVDRGNYLALDRPDIAYSAKEPCQCFADPNEDAMVALQKLVRHRCGASRVVWDDNFQPMCHSPATAVDTEFAGGLATRRATSGGASMRGRHLIKHRSTTQVTVTLSSAEAELGGITNVASTSMGVRTIAADPGFRWDISIQTDSTAAGGICRRRGLGKIRHLAAADPWVQYLVRNTGFQT